MLHSYLEKKTHSLLIFAFLVAFLFSTWTVVLFIVLIYSSLLFLFRKIPPEESYSQGEVKGALFSPANGKVQHAFQSEPLEFFGKTFQALVLVVQPWSEYGLVLPCAAEVEDFQFKPGRRTFRWPKLPKGWEEFFQGLGMTFRTRNETEFGLQFFRCWLGKWPEISILPGDRGKAKATFGHLPLGGRVIVYIPQNYEILTKTGDDAIAGVTMLAAPKDDGSQEGV